MGKNVTVDIIDKATRKPTGATEVVVLDNAIAHLVYTGVFLTDNDGVFFQRQLEYIQAQSYDVLYPELKARMIFAMNSEGGEGINQITYRSYDKRGRAKIISGKGTDLPRADIDGKEYTIDVRTIGTSYGYSLQEIAASDVTGLQLDARKAAAATKAYEEEFNKLSFFGSAPDNIGGLFGGPAGGPWSTITNTQVAAPGTGTNRTWGGGNKTPDEVIKDLSIACITMVEDTLQIHKPNKILMSVAKKNYLMMTPRSLQSDRSIMSWFIEASPYINSEADIIAVNELDGVFGATPGINGGSQGFVVMEDMSDNLRLREPLPLKSIPVQYHGLELMINMYGRFAGLEIIRPAAINFWYGT